jgi:SAM-dependent methyltransferase
MTTPPRHISRYTNRNVPAEADGRLCSPSFERNFEPILAALAARLGNAPGTVLEIGAGTGQHAAHLAAALPAIRWVPSDPDPGHRASIAAWARALAPANLAPPLALDATTAWWESEAVEALGPLRAIYAQNVLHIAPWPVAEGIARGAARTLGPGGALVFYGPFAEGGRHTGEGNARFDAALRAENADWGVRDIDDVERLARAAGLGPAEVTVMPSNNRILAFAKE